MGRVQGRSLSPVAAVLDQSTGLRAEVRAELERLARAGRVATYGDLAASAGTSTAALMPALDAIRAENARRGRPDLACLAVAMRTALPRGMGREEAAAAQAAVFEAWA